MRKLIVIAFAFCLSFINLNADEIRGERLSFYGFDLLRLEGNHYERGYAYGKLIPEKIFEIYHNYFIERVLNSNLGFYNFLLQDFKEKAIVDPRFYTEAEAVVNAFNESQWAESVETLLGRQMHTDDLLLANTIVELVSQYGCSSLMSWNESTQDSELAGEIVICRLLDWPVTPELANNHLITFHIPTEEDEQAWVSFGFAGLIGVLSGVNQSGLAVFQNMGNKEFYDGISEYEPVFFALRRAIERKDLNGDGLSKTNDVFESLSAEQKAGSFIVSAVAPIASGDSAIVIECAGDRIQVRHWNENSNLPGRNLATTNHFRVLYSPEYCSRYNNIQYRLMQDSTSSIEKNWNLHTSAAGVPGFNLQAMQYVPSTQFIRFSASTLTKSAYQMEPIAFYFDDLFTFSSVNGFSDFFGKLNIIPNPASEKISISFESEEIGFATVAIYDSFAREIHSQNVIIINSENYLNLDIRNLSTGIYFVKIQSNKKTITSKFSVIK